MHDNLLDGKPYPFRKGSQNDRIVRYLLTGKPLLNWQMRELFGCLSHTARISEIREKGFDVMAKELKEGVWQYWLPERGLE